MVEHLVARPALEKDAAKVDVEVFEDALVIVVGARPRPHRRNRRQPQVVAQAQIGVVQQHGSIAHQVARHTVRRAVTECANHTLAMAE